MQPYRNTVTILIGLSILASAIVAYTEEEIEDLVDVFESNGKIIAVIDGERKVTFGLRPGEKVLWSGSNGYLGAFLTNGRFFVISTPSSTWQILPLKTDESEDAAVFLSPYLALLVTRDRAICFNRASSRFLVTHLPTDDGLALAKAEKRVAVVITSSSAIGFSGEASAFVSIPFRIRETMRELKLTSDRATVRTSGRLLIFNASKSAWTIHSLD